MKILFLLTLISIFSVSPVLSDPVTNINAVYKNGQVFITWDTTPGQFFILYKSSSPIIYGNQLSAAQNLGLVPRKSAINFRFDNRYFRIDSAAPPIAPGKGLSVATSTSNGLFYYAVTVKTNGIEDTTIILGSNSLSLPVNETVSEPKPVWQDSIPATKTFHVYVWFATKITSGTFPLMTNSGFYPFNFGICKQGAQSPHPVTFYMMQSNAHYLQPTWGTGDPNEFLISIDDYQPNSDANNKTYYYGYHENYDFYGPNTFPETGTIYNYTAAMVSHTVRWALKNLPLDSTRMYMTGHSLGAMGTLLNSLVMIPKIAAIFIYGPVFNLAARPIGWEHVLWGTYQTNLFTNEGLSRNERLNVNNLLSINRLNSIPIIYSICGKIDADVGWEEKIAFYDSINVLRHGGYHFWSMSSHQEILISNPWKIAPYPPRFPFFTRYRTNLSYPAFSNCSVNNNPGNGNPTNGDSLGQINGHLDWNDNIVDTITKWEITLKTKELVKSNNDTLDAPDSCTADVTLRRLQKFNPSIGHVIQWTNTKNNVVVQQGIFTYTGDLITIFNVKIYKQTNKLSLINNSVGITKNSKEVPAKFELEQNYPNPFNSMTKIRLQVKGNKFVKLIIFDLLGREVATLVNEKLQPGIYEVSFDAGNLPSGTYFYKLTAGEFTDTKRMILIK